MRDESDLVRNAFAGMASPVTLRYDVPDVGSAVVRGERALLYLAIRRQADDIPPTAANGRKAAVGVLDEATSLERVLAAA